MKIVNRMSLLSLNTSSTSGRMVLQALGILAVGNEGGNLYEGSGR